jgi:hypothetical protein
MEENEMWKITKERVWIILVHFTVFKQSDSPNWMLWDLYVSNFLFISIFSSICHRSPTNGSGAQRCHSWTLCAQTTSPVYACAYRTPKKKQSRVYSVELFHLHGECFTILSLTSFSRCSLFFRPGVINEGPAESLCPWDHWPTFGDGFSQGLFDDALSIAEVIY